MLSMKHWLKEVIDINKFPKSVEQLPHPTIKKNHFAEPSYHFPGVNYHFADANWEKPVLHQHFLDEAKKS